MMKYLKKKMEDVLHHENPSVSPFAVPSLCLRYSFAQKFFAQF